MRKASQVAFIPKVESELILPECGIADIESLISRLLDEGLLVSESECLSAVAALHGLTYCGSSKEGSAGYPALCS